MKFIHNTPNVGVICLQHGEINIICFQNTRKMT